VLRACHRLLRPGGRLAFTTIHTPPGLAAEQMQRADALGPPTVAEPQDHVEMLRVAGFVEPEQIDVTNAYLGTARAWFREREAAAAELIGLEGEQAFRDRQLELRNRIAGPEERIIGRSILAARRPL